MFHYVYCIENLINGKVYVGKHSTNDLDDGYMGSGTLLNRAIKKHGIENFRKHVLETFQTSEEALEFEKQLVTEELVADNNTYNLTLGGAGSWYSANVDDRIREIRSEKMRIQNLTRWKNDLDYRQHMIDVSSETFKRLWSEGKLKHPDWTGKRHSDETKRKIGQANAVWQKGERNSQFGTVWIYNSDLNLSRKIKKEELDLFISQGWIKGRRMK
jgi:group I intron endonuclease